MPLDQAASKNPQKVTIRKLVYVFWFMVIFLFFALIIVAASQSFVPLLSQTKQQSKIAVSNIEGMLGLEVMRRDIAHAGYGLFWSFDPKSAPRCHVE